VTLLVISPDYASHLYPLATLATAWRDAGERVVVATGPATHDLVEGFGYTRTELRLGRGSNPGVIRAEDQPRGEDDALRGFFDATRQGAVATLAFQARARRSDLLWDPVGSARAVHRVVDEVRPDHVVVDHLAFSARIALTAGGIPHADVVLGHPTALTVGDEVYGCPPAFPRAIQPAPEELAELRSLCEQVRDDFTDQWNAALAVLAPQAPPSHDAFAETGDVLRLVVLGFGPAGPRFRYATVRVAGTFESGFAEFDRSWVALERSLVRRLSGGADGGGATELVELHAPAHVRGDIRTRALYMDKGVLFDGSCVMGQVVELDALPAPSRAADDTSPDGYKDQPTRS